jgi:uncharacterized Zn finger protein (UPF0148 family)
MNWENTLKAKKKSPQEIFKEVSPILDDLDKKQKRKLKKTLQASEPTEYFGQDFAKLGELVDILKELELIKSDTKLKKKMQSLEEKNISIVSTATKLRKEYEEVYRALRGSVYPKRKGDLRDE